VVPDVSKEFIGFIVSGEVVYPKFRDLLTHQCSVISQETGILMVIVLGVLMCSVFIFKIC
jgi:uncharacterized membrane protein